MAHRDRPAVPGDSGPFPRDRVLNSCPADLHLGLRAPGVDQLSRAMRTRAQGLVLLTSYPVGLWPGSEGPWCGPALPGDSCLCPSALVFDQQSRVTRCWVHGPSGQPAVPGNSGLFPRPGGVPDVPGDSRLCPRARGVYQLSQATCPVSECLRVRPPLPGKSPSSLMAHGVDQLSRGIRAKARGPAVSTGCLA